MDWLVIPFSTDVNKKEKKENHTYIKLCKWSILKVPPDLKYFTIPFHSPWNSHDAHLFKEKQSTAPKKMSVLLWWTAIRHYCLALNWYFRLPNLRECSMPPQVHFGWKSRWCQNRAEQRCSGAGWKWRSVYWYPHCSLIIWLHHG